MGWHSRDAVHNKKHPSNTVLDRHNLTQNLLIVKFVQLVNTQWDFETASTIIRSFQITGVEASNRFPI